MKIITMVQQVPIGDPELRAAAHAVAQSFAETLTEIAQEELDAQGVGKDIPNVRPGYRLARAALLLIDAIPYSIGGLVSDLEIDDTERRWAPPDQLLFNAVSWGIVGPGEW